LKIAFFVHDYHRHGGHCRYVAELASRFKRDHEVHIFANRWEEPDPAHLTFHHVPAWTWRELTKVFSFILPATLMAPKGFDIVHSQGLCGLRHNITTTHFNQAAWFRETGKRGIPVGAIGWFWKYFVAPMEKYALGPSCSQHVISISKGVEEDLVKEYGITKNIHRVYHGVDLDRFHPSQKDNWRVGIRQEIGLTNETFLALFVGNLKKGAAVAIKAVAMVPGIHLALVSGSKNTYEKKLVQQLSICDRIHWVPMTKAVEKYFSAADCFVFPTVYEPFGMVISEAMASGLPVITSRSAGASDLITHGRDGYLLDEPWDEIGIAKYLMDLKADPANAKAMGVAARKAIEPYTWDRCAQETMKVYQMVLAEKLSD
jgi:UDP-glucose:(heptosyl)LPS alpha-1,3-glucosyltransferase